MPQSVNLSSALANAERKKQLLAEGALHRASILVARADIAAGLQPGALVKDTFSHITETAKFALLDTLRVSAANPGKLAPLLITTLSLLSKAYIRKPLMYAGIAGGAIAGVIYLVKLFSNDDTGPNDLDDAPGD